MQAAKKKVGLFLPVAMADALDEMTARVGKKQKWLIVGAALLRLLQTEEETQNELIRQVKIADLPGGSFDQLIASARSLASRPAAATSDRPASFHHLVAVESSRTQTTKTAAEIATPNIHLSNLSSDSRGQKMNLVHHRRGVASTSASRKQKRRSSSE